MKSQQLPLLAQSIGIWSARRISFFAVSCGGLFTVHDGRDNIGRQQGKTQELGDVTRCNALLTGDGVQRELRALHQTLMNIMRAGDNSQQAGIG